MNAYIYIGEQAGLDRVARHGEVMREELEAETSQSCKSEQDVANWSMAIGKSYT